MLQHVTACCSMLQLVAAYCCRVLQFIAPRHTPLQAMCVLWCCNLLQHVAVLCCSVLQGIANSMLQCVVVHCTSSCSIAGHVCCRVLQHIAARCRMLQRVAVPCCNELQCLLQRVAVPVAASCSALHLVLCQCTSYVCLQGAAVCCSMLQSVAVQFVCAPRPTPLQVMYLQGVAVCCSMLQSVAVQVVYAPRLVCTCEATHVHTKRGAHLAMCAHAFICVT